MDTCRQILLSPEDEIFLTGHARHRCQKKSKKPAEAAAGSTKGSLGNSGSQIRLPSPQFTKKTLKHSKPLHIQQLSEAYLFRVAIRRRLQGARKCSNTLGPRHPSGRGVLGPALHLGSPIRLGLVDFLRPCGHVHLPRKQEMMWTSLGSAPKLFANHSCGRLMYRADANTGSPSSACALQPMLMSIF